MNHLSWVKKKLHRKIAKSFVFIALAPIALLIRIIRPIYRIQFLITPVKQLGHQVGNLDVHLIKTLINKPKRTTFIYFCPCIVSRSIANKQIHLMWSRELPTFVRSPFLTKIILAFAVVCWKIPYFNVVIQDIWIKPHNACDKDTTGRMAALPSFLKFTQKEILFGEAMSRKIGLQKKSNHILLHSRIDVGNDDRNKHRNSKIESFFEAAKYLTVQGYDVIRTGATIHEAIDESIDYIIDYASKYRTDFMDVYLAANCAFYLGDTCGLFNVPIAFRKPIAITNQAPIFFSPFCHQRALIISKKFWLKQEKRYMTLSELMQTGTAYITNSSDYALNGIEAHDNTPEEILDLAIEMHQRLNGTYQETAEGQHLQDLFFKKVTQDPLLLRINGAIRAKVATSFLIRNSFFTQ